MHKVEGKMCDVPSQFDHHWIDGIGHMIKISKNPVQLGKTFLEGILGVPEAIRSNLQGLRGFRPKMPKVGHF